MRRTTRLRTLLDSGSMTVLMEAHHGLSAKLVEEAGFEAVWASGLTMSAALGVRDCNEASWTQLLAIAEFMSDATTLPILFDGDTGFGNFNNVRRLIRKLEQRGIAGVCLEDKQFPKVNSLLPSAMHALADKDEVCGKLRAAKDHQTDSDFVVVARTEAFIEGRGLEEALDRSYAYADCGADAILVHSKCKDAGEVLSFAERWTLGVPLIAVPTTYSSVSLETLHVGGVTNTIFANQALRAEIRALQSALGELYRTRRISSIEHDIVPLEEIFRLQNVAELREAEDRYLTHTAENALTLAGSSTDGR